MKLRGHDAHSNSRTPLCALLDCRLLRLHATAIDMYIKEIHATPVSLHILVHLLALSLHPYLAVDFSVPLLDG